MKIPAFVLLFLRLSIPVSAQFTPGYYLDSAGNKVPGYLRYTYGGNFFVDQSKGDGRLLYKPDSAATKTTKFSSKDIKGFVMGSDSFTVIHGLRISPSVYYKQDFVRVLETGKIRLLQHDRRRGALKQPLT